MTHLFLPTLALALTVGLASGASAQQATPDAAPSPAQPEEAGPDALRDGFDMLSEGTRLLLRGLGAELAPLMQDLSELIDDLNAYHAPEILPNGDIILRRKAPGTPDPEPKMTPDTNDAPVTEL